MHTQIGYVIIPQNFMEGEEKENLYESQTEVEMSSSQADTLSIYSLSEESFAKALRQYVSNCITDIDIKNKSLLFVSESENYSPSIHFSLEAIPSISQNKQEENNCNDNTNNNTTYKKFTVITFCLIPHILDSNGEVCDDNILQRMSNNAEHVDSVDERNKNICFYDALLTSVPFPKYVCLKGHNVQIKVITIAKTIKSQSMRSETTISTSAHRNSSSSSDVSNVVKCAKWLMNKPLLMIGAGGIGCELLKVLVLYGFHNIHIIDLDTIDATNLNRQFLFTNDDIGKSKAHVARKAVLNWFTSESHEHEISNNNNNNTLMESVIVQPPPHIVAHHAQVQAPEFDELFFAQFACVLSALDNVKARQHVNRMCAKVHVPLIESGTMGYNGQVQPIEFGKYECYDCRPKPPDTQTFAVCTIHARPTTMVHCVHFAKELYNTLFANDSIDIGDNNFSNSYKYELTNSVNEETEEQTHDATSHKVSIEEKQDGEGINGSSNRNTTKSLAQKDTSGNELSYLTHLLETCLLTASFNNVTEALLRFSYQLAEKLFHDKVAELLSMKSDWPTEPPTPISIAVLDVVYEQMLELHKKGILNINDMLRCSNRHMVLAVEDELMRFILAAIACTVRLQENRFVLQEHNNNNNNNNDDNNNKTNVEFSKNDEMAMSFVAATANLRAANFHITTQSLEEIRTIAGAIVPAIATTNAMVAAGVVRELILTLESTSNKCSAEFTNACEINKDYDNTDKVVPQMVYVRKVAQRRRRAAAITNPFIELISCSERSTEHYNKSIDANTQMKGKTNLRHNVSSLYYHDHYLLHPAPLPLPSLFCEVCQRRLPRLEVILFEPKISPLEKWTIDMFVEQILHNALHMDEVSITCNDHIIYEEGEYETLCSETLIHFITLPSEEAKHSKRVKLDKSSEHNSNMSEESIIDEDSNTVQNAEECNQLVNSDYSNTCPSLILLVDALNKEVEWEIIVRQATHSAETTNQLFCFTNLEEALQIEAAAIKRQMQQQQCREDDDNSNNYNNNSINRDEDGNVIDISDSEENDNDEAECCNNVQQRANDDNYQHNDCEDDVIIIDD